MDEAEGAIEGRDGWVEREAIPRGRAAAVVGIVTDAGKVEGSGGGGGMVKPPVGDPKAASGEPIPLTPAAPAAPAGPVGPAPTHPLASCCESARAVGGRGEMGMEGGPCVRDVEAVEAVDAMLADGKSPTPLC